ncbi:MAG TPA: response regulator transcription factor, partial [Intrasporangiaceae bacterium]|nr:response regulator transcription factor [Intrasporangiaceae bacterium]
MTRVVLAEDDPAISEPLARALLREGYTVDVAPDGAQALSMAGAGVDLLILDLGLPEIDG